jgi:drug/metabolite transporter (DMT)-like permease
MSLNLNAWIKMLYLGLTFGLSLTILKIIFQTMDDPIWILFCQSTFSSILLLAFALFSKSDLSALRSNFGALALLATFGVIVPNIALYASARHISVGSMSLLLALIPFFVYIIALLTKLEKLNLLRIFGLTLGFCAMFLLIFPGTHLEIGIAKPWLLVGVLTPIFIASANVFLSRARFRPVDPISIALGMNSLTAIVLAPIVYFTSSSPFILKSAGLSLAVLSLSVITSVGFIVFVKLIKNHGPVFASQVNYLVTISGVAWGFIIFSESHSSQFWFALGLILCGLFCVRPNGKKSMM